MHLSSYNSTSNIKKFNLQNQCKMVERIPIYLTIDHIESVASFCKLILRTVPLISLFCFHLIQNVPQFQLPHRTRFLMPNTKDVFCPNHSKKKRPTLLSNLMLVKEKFLHDIRMAKTGQGSTRFCMFSAIIIAGVYL